MQVPTGHPNASAEEVGAVDTEMVRHSAEIQRSSADREWAVRERHRAKAQLMSIGYVAL